MLLIIFLFTVGALLPGILEAQSNNTKKYEEQWPALVVLQAAEQAVNTSSLLPVGTYDYYYFVFIFSKGIWTTYVEHYIYVREPTPYIGTEIFYFKNNGKQVFEMKKTLE